MLRRTEEEVDLASQRDADVDAVVAVVVEVVVAAADVVVVG